MECRIPEFVGNPIAKADLRFFPAATGDTLRVDFLNWDGEPDLAFYVPQSHLA